MAISDKPVEVPRISCEVCLKEVPISEATVFEATDYFVHFCGLECFEKWKNEGGKPKEAGEAPSS
jgi:Domain of unknown function (DUF3330)